MNLVVLCGEFVKREVQGICRASDHLLHYPLDAIAHPADLEGLTATHVVLVEWDDLYAPYYRSFSTLARWHEVPIIAVLPTDGAASALALMSGMDCFATLPLTLRLLYAQVHAYHHLVETVRGNERIRQEMAHLGEQEAPMPPQGGVLALDLQAQQFLVQGQPLGLSVREYDLLHYLAAHPGQMLSRDRLLREVWGLDCQEIQTNVVDVYVSYLRQKLAAHGVTGLIETVRGRGYRYHPPREAGPYARPPALRAYGVA